MKTLGILSLALFIGLSAASPRVELAYNGEARQDGVISKIFMLILTNSDMFNLLQLVVIIVISSGLEVIYWVGLWTNFWVCLSQLCAPYDYLRVGKVG